MAIEISQNSIVSPHLLFFKTGEKYLNKDLYFFSVSGISLPNFKGNSSNWRRDELMLNIKIPTHQIPIASRPSPSHFAVFKSKSWTVFAGINSMYNNQASINNGYAVDAFELLNPHYILDALRVECRIATVDNNAILFRVGFKVDLLLYFDRWDAFK